MISRRALVAGSGALLLPKRARAVVMMPNTFNLAFPGGRAPGFDPNHVAMSGGGVCRFSSVILGGSVHTNLLTGKGPDSTSGTLSSKVFNNASYAVDTSTTLEKFTTGINFVTDTAFSVAAIFYFTTVISSTIFLFGSGGQGIGIGTASNLGLTAGGTRTNTGIVVVVNTPYFVLAGRVGTGTNQAIALVLNLLTGAITTAKFTQSISSVAPTEVDIGATASATQCGIAATAYISGNPSFAMYQAWALDPWSFWYPNRLQDLTQ